MPQNCLVLLESPAGMGAFSIQSQLWDSEAALALCCKSLGLDPWTLLALLLQESFGVVLDDPFAA